MRTVLLALIFFIVAVLLLNDQLEPFKNERNHSNYLDKIKDRPIILCHRGSRYMGVENSIEMFQWALQMGCDVLEFDIRLTKDNQLVVFHDSTVDRVTNGSGHINSFTVSELREFDIGYNYTYQGEHPFRNQGFKIPLFDDVLATLKGEKMNIEIKDNDNKVSEMLWDKLEEQGDAYFENIVVASRWCEPLEHFRKISEGRISTSACEKESMLFLLATKLGIQNVVYSLVQPKANLYQIPSTSSGLHFDSKKYVDAAHNLGQGIMFWVINNDEHMDRIFNLGSDGIVTDRPDLAYQVLMKRNVVVENKMAEIPKEKINSVEGFFIPESNPYEVHRCVSFACFMIPLLMDRRLWTVLNVVAIVIFLTKKLGTKKRETMEKEE